MTRIFCGQARGRGRRLRLSGLPDDLSKSQQLPGSHLSTAQDLEEVGHFDVCSAERKSECFRRLLKSEVIKTNNFHETEKKVLTNLMPVHSVQNFPDSFQE